MPKQLLIFPFGGNAREAAAIIAGSSALRKKWRVLGFMDDDASTHGQKSCGVPVLGGREILKKYPAVKILAVPGSPGNYLKRRHIIEGLGLKAGRFTSVVASTAVVAPDARIGYNTLLSTNVVVGCGTVIGNHCVILPNTTIGHDAVIEDDCCIGANVAISGHVTVRSGCYIGSGVTVRERVTIQGHSLVGIGSNVITDIEKKVIVAGNPARLLKI